MIIDAHNHLHDPRLAPHRESILEKLVEAGIQKCVVNGTHPDDWDAVLALHQQFPDLIIPALGLHPWKVKDRPDDWFDQLQSYYKVHPYITIGECGLDKWIREPHIDAQIECFKAQLDFATTHNLPVSIHCLKAWGLLLETLGAHELPARGIHIHGFGGSHEVANQLLKHNAHFSFCGYFLEPRKQAVRDVFSTLPLDRIMLESDAPDMLLPEDFNVHPLPEKLNSPLNLPTIAEHLASIRKTTPKAIHQATTANSLRYFLSQ